MMKNRKNRGFTLIEVLIALAIIAIALTALLKATSQNTTITQRIKEKSIGHWVAMQGVALIQLGLINIPPNQESTNTITMAGEKWYWRVLITSTEVPHVQQINVTVSQKQDGDFGSPLTAFWFV